MTTIDERLRRLPQDVTPSDAFRGAVKAKLTQRMEPVALRSLAQEVHPGEDARLSLRKRLLRMIQPRLGRDLRRITETIGLSSDHFALLRSAILGRLQPITQSAAFHGLLKWGAAFAILILVIRAMPLLLLAPSSRADLGVQVIPAGEHVSIYAGGVWNTIDQPLVLSGPAMISTEEAGASVILHDDGVLRIGPHSAVRIHDLADLPRGEGKGPLATLVRGDLWILGLVPPFVDGLSVEVPGAIASINTGSVGMERDDGSTVISVFDRSATVGNAEQTAFLVSGERVTVHDGRALSIVASKLSTLSDPWVASNLEQDAVHRADIAARIREERSRAAGILPNSFLYSAKRLAEEVDVLFALSEESRIEKRIEQANTRLKEALALLQEGESSAAQIPLSEYSESLIAMAGDSADNLVQHVIREQIAEASAGIGAEDEPSAAGSIELLTSAVNSVSAAIPATDLAPADIEGYILVGELARINQTLSGQQNPEAAAAAYADIRPYLENLLSEDSGTHPLLKKEAVSLLVTTTSLVEEATSRDEENAVLQSLAEDIAQYVPAEQEAIRATEAELTTTVAGIVDRIFLFRHPTSRYNQLILEMSKLVGNPDRGTILRRLRVQLPPDGLGGIVEAEIKKLGDELKGGQ